MANDNTVTVIGNATRDPELRFTNSGTAKATFGIAYNKRKKNRDTGEWEDQDPAFFNIVCWGQMAENIAESITKGTRVVVFGRLDQRSWEDEKSGDKRSVVEIIAEEVCASMRWATVSVTKNERRGSGGGGGSSSGGGRSSGGSGGGGGYDPDEEPF